MTPGPFMHSVLRASKGGIEHVPEVPLLKRYPDTSVEMAANRLATNPNVCDHLGVSAGDVSDLAHTAPACASTARPSCL